MFGSLGAPEIIIIALVVILLFGVGKISGLGKELGSSIKEFRRAVKDPDEETKAQQQAQAQVAPPQPQQYVQQPQVTQPTPYTSPPAAQAQYVPPQQQYAPQPPQPPKQGDGKEIF